MLLLSKDEYFARRGGVEKGDDCLLEEIFCFSNSWSFFGVFGEVLPFGIGFTRGEMISIVDPVPTDCGLSPFIPFPGGERDWKGVVTLTGVDVLVDV